MSNVASVQSHSHTHRPAGTRPAQQHQTHTQQQSRPEQPRDRVELSAQATQSRYTAPNESNDFVRDNVVDRTPEVKQRQEESIRGALRSNGQPFEHQNSAGQRESYTLRATETNGTYELRGQDGHTLRVNLDERMSESERVSALASITDFQSRIPAHLRDALDDITVTNDSYQTGENSRLEGFARKSSMTIYEGLNFLDNGVLDHEFGHNLGYKLELREAVQQASLPIPGAEGAVTGPLLLPSHTPPGWRSAVQADGRAPSQYARDNNAAEDFAEAYVAYREAQEHGPEALEELRRQYPERMRYLDGVMTPPRTFWSAAFEQVMRAHADLQAASNRGVDVIA